MELISYLQDAFSSLHSTLGLGMDLLAHTTSGLAISRAFKGKGIEGIATSFLPDSDFLIPGIEHSTLTHSPYAIPVLAGFYAGFRKGQNPNYNLIKGLGIALSGCATHYFIDQTPHDMAIIAASTGYLLLNNIKNRYKMLPTE